MSSFGSLGRVLAEFAIRLHACGAMISCRPEMIFRTPVAAAFGLGSNTMRKRPEKVPTRGCAHLQEGLIMKSIAMFILALFISILSGVAQAQSIEWKLKKGQAISVETINEMVTNMTLPDGSNQELPMKQQMDSEWKIKDSDEKSFSVDQTVKRVRVTMKSPFMNVDFDSDKGDAKDPFSKQFEVSMKPLLGAPVLLKLGRRGDLMDMQFPDSIKELSASPTNPINAESLKSTYQQVVVFPEGDLTVGKTWEQKVKANNNGMQTESVLKLRFAGIIEEQGRKIARIDNDTLTELVQAPPGIEMTIEDATGDGEILFDVELGCITKAIQRQKMKMIISVGGQKISQDIEGTTTTIFRLAN
jgi:hypothetical protein